MRIEGQKVEFEYIPTLVVVRSELSKAGHQYLTFLSEEGCDYLKDYLETRMREGEELAPESAIVTPKRRMKPFIRATNVGDIIRSAVRKAGFSWRPYVLRSYFDTQLARARANHPSARLMNLAHAITRANKKGCSYLKNGKKALIYVTDRLPAHYLDSLE